MTEKPPIDFENDLRKEILTYLPHPEDAASLQMLSNMRIDDLLICFYNWLERNIQPKPRSIFVSTEFIQNPLYNLHLKKINSVIYKIQSGLELNPHLSQRAKNGFIKKNPFSNELLARRDLDMLLNDWGIHHLHLSNGSKELLFSIFTETDCYILDIGMHDRFADKKLVEIGVKNWPEIELFYEIHGLAPHELSDKEYETYRNIGVGTNIVIEGKTYISRALGIMTSGISLKHTKKSMQLMFDIAEFTKLFHQDHHCFRDCFLQTRHTYPENPIFKLILVQCQLGITPAIQEQITGAIFWPGTPPFYVLKSSNN